MHNKNTVGIRRSQTAATGWIPATNSSFCVGRCLRALALSSVTLLLFCVRDSSVAAGPGQRPTATWDTNPVSSDWNTAANWTPNIVPNGEDNIAKFDFSTVTQVTTSAFPVVHEIIFNPNASAFTIFGPLGVHGGGITNNSGFVQNFVGRFFFEKADAGSNTSFHTNGELLFFVKESSAGNATITNSGGTKSGAPGGSVDFFLSTAGNAKITNNGGAVAGALGGVIRFRKSNAENATIINEGAAVSGALGGLIKLGKAGAGNATFINNGGAVFGAQGARMEFNKSFGNDATLIANGGKGPGSGAKIEFKNGSNGLNARVELFGNGNLDVSRPRPEADSVGSIEGDGLIFLGASQLTVGANNRSTTFAGTISDEGGVATDSGGSLVKGGTGTLTLTGANTYSGGTEIMNGTLLVQNKRGSATGSGTVNVSTGTLGGNGIVGGDVSVGGTSAILAPAGKNGAPVGMLTIQGGLTFKSVAFYNLDVDSGSATADQVIAHGVTIKRNAFIELTDIAQGNLPPGTVLTIIKTTASTPINGTFGNLHDGGTITVKKNAFKANYEGGDGNDLTLTVQ